MSKTKIILSVLLLTGILIISGCGCKQKNTKKYDLSLEIWGTLDSRDALTEIFDNYKKIDPNISAIEYKKLSTDTYKKELIEALASGQGPDIFMINNAWVPSFSDKILPAPQAATVINEQKFLSNFPDVAADDLTNQGQIYAVPLSIDSLGLYYNKDLFNQAGIVSPPRTWNEFIDDVRKLTKFDAYNQIITSGAAIGTAYNINRSTDILNLLMLQNNTEMIDKYGKINFDRSVSSDGKSVSPGENALNFYTQFARSGSLNYTWNQKMHYSIDAFSEGATAMMFNYSWHINTIRNKAPKLNFAVSSIPQFEDGPKANFANYWAFAVAKNKNINNGANGSALITNEIRVGESWQFLTYLTTKPDGTWTAALQNASGGLGRQADPNFDPAESYLKKSGEPAARRDLIEKQKSDPWVGAFASDNLIAKSWRQADSEAVEVIFAEMIDSVNKGQATVSEAIKSAAQRVQNLGR